MRSKQAPVDDKKKLSFFFLMAIDEAKANETIKWVQDIETEFVQRIYSVTTKTYTKETLPSCCVYYHTTCSQQLSDVEKTNDSSVHRYDQRWYHSPVEPCPLREERVYNAFIAQLKDQGHFCWLLQAFLHTSVPSLYVLSERIYQGKLFTCLKSILSYTSQPNCQPVSFKQYFAEGPWCKDMMKGDSHVKSLYNTIFGWTLVSHDFVQRLAHICVLKGKSVQDWGCGRGMLSILLAYELKEQKSQLHVEAVDTFEESGTDMHLKYCQQYQQLQLTVKHVKRPWRSYETIEDSDYKESKDATFQVKEDYKCRQPYISNHAYDCPDPTKTLLISWGRDLDYVVNSYIQSGGRCIIVIGENEDGCTFFPQHPLLPASKQSSDTRNPERQWTLNVFPAPNFQHMFTYLFVFTAPHRVLSLQSIREKQKKKIV